MPRGNRNNLQPVHTNEEAKALGKKGGVASGIARRKRKEEKDRLLLLLESKPHLDKEEAQKLQERGINPKSIDNETLVTIALVDTAINGDVAAIKYIDERTGKNPSLELKKKELELKQPSVDEESNHYYGLPARVLGRAYVDIDRDIDARRHRFYDFKGGRGSLKSSYCGLKLIDLIMQNDNFCGLALRQVKDTLKDSVYAQIVWAIDELGLTEYFHCTISPMQIRRKDTGQIIYFRGADEPGKIKSIKPPNGMHIGVLWIEEADQLHGEAMQRNILQSIMRGGDDIIVFRSYNTPISQKHFINVDARKNRPNRILHHSHYRDAPSEWLGEGFFELADELKAANPKAFAHEYDGEATGTGGTVFENVRTSEITDKEISQFDQLYYGLDFGWFPDPTAYVKCYYSAAQRRLFIFDEFRVNKANSQAIADLLREHGVSDDDMLICDYGAGGDRVISDLVNYGFYARGAEKGPGSVSYSMKWLQGLTEIIIDPKRCPHTADEFVSYEYERNKDNEIITGYPDKNNHHIDAARYALNLIWRQRGN